MKHSQKQIYLLHGNDEIKLNDVRCQIVDSLLAKEEREENLKEYSPKGLKTRVYLPEILQELMMELGTISFFPDSRRVVVIYNLDELYSSKRSSSSAAQKKESDKKSRKSDKPSNEARLVKYLEESLQSTNNIIIFQNAEDKEDYIWVNQHGALYKTIIKLGEKFEHSVQPLSWQLEKTINERDLKGALNIVKTWFMKDSDGARSKIYNSLCKTILLLLQAKVIASKRKQRMPLDQMRQMFFPSDLKYNLLDKNQKGSSYIEKASEKYTIAELNSGLNKLLPIGSYVYPRTTDLYVPDMQFLYEKFLVEFIGEATPQFKYGIKYH